MIRRTVAVVALAAVGPLSACGGGSTGATKTVTVTSTTVQVQNEGTKTVTYRPPPPPGPKTSIDSDGTYAIGTDIQPGVYRTAGPVRTGRDCYYKRLASFDSSDIIDNEGTSGPQVVEILPSDVAFSTSNCQPWEKAG